MVSWSLTKRTAYQNNNWFVRNPGYTCGQGSSGQVTVQIKVNQNGNVIEASIVSASGANSCIKQQAIKYAKMSRFNFSGSAPSAQIGTIVYTFVSQ
jgi:TonB family protein